MTRIVVLAVAVLSINSVPLLGQSNLARLIDLVDKESIHSYNEIKQLREKNGDNSQSPLFDFGFAISAIKHGRLQEATQVLQPFVDKRPHVWQARILLLRTYIDLEHFDDAVLQGEKLLANFPSQVEHAKAVARFCGTFVGYLNFARPDCSNELKLRFEEAAESKIAAEYMEDYRKAFSLVESRVAEIDDEIKHSAERVDSEIRIKLAEGLTEADKLRDKSKSVEDEQKAREALRAQKFDELKLKLQGIERDYSSMTARHVFLENQIDSLRRQRDSLEREETTKDKDGNKTTRTVITNQSRHNELGRRISEARSEQSRVEVSGRALLNEHAQLRVLASGLLNQNQMDELFSQSQMKQLGKAAENTEKKAERESERKGKNSQEVRRLNNLRKNFSTYLPVDFASNKEFLKEISKKFLAK